jgi:flagellar M-ring protein FliF
MRPPRDPRRAELPPAPAGGARQSAATPIDVMQVDSRVRSLSRRKVGEIIDKHPDEALAILRAWLHRER